MVVTAILCDSVIITTILFELAVVVHAVHVVLTVQVEHLTGQAKHAAAATVGSKKPAAHLYIIIFKINTHNL